MNVIAGLLLACVVAMATQPQSAKSLPESAAKAPDLPRVVRLRICRVTVHPAQHEHLRASRPASAAPAIEFIVETDGTVPALAYGPALFVGPVEVNESERIGPTTWRLLAFEPERLKPGAVIRWGWMKAPTSARLSTPFRYAIERNPRACAAQP